MSAHAKQITRIPVSISAKTRQDLTLLCLNNNLKHQTEFHYFQIIKDGKEWVAWYYADIEKYPVLNRAK